MTSLEVDIVIRLAPDALELFELGSDVQELYDLVPEWCVERDPVAERIAQRLRGLIKTTIAAGRRGGT